MPHLRKRTHKGTQLRRISELAYWDCLWIIVDVWYYNRTLKNIIRFDWNRTNRIYKVHVNALPVQDQSPGVRQLLKHLLKDVKCRMQCRPNDYLWLNLHHPSLDSDIWFEFTQSQSLDEYLFLNKVQTVQQFKKGFTLTDGAAELELLHIQYPQESGGNQMKMKTYKLIKWFLKVSSSLTYFKLGHFMFASGHRSSPFARSEAFFYWFRGSRYLE